MTPAVRAELERLLTGLLDDALGTAELFRLNEILSDDADCRRFYLEYVDLHARLLHHPRLAAMAEAELQAEAERAADIERNVEANRASELVTRLETALGREAMASLHEAAGPALAAKPNSVSRWPSYLLTVAATIAATIALQIVWQRPLLFRGPTSAGGGDAAATAKLPPPAAAPATPTIDVGTPAVVAPSIIAAPSIAAQPVVATAADVAAATAATEVDEPKPLPAYVATLSQTVDCEWPDNPSLHEGMRLTPNMLRLRKGTATIRFDGGAELKLTGPALLRIVSLNSAVLHIGRVLFHSDDAAERFDLRTPHSQMLDYGTEYAVVVNPAGEELHVFEGEVVRKSPKNPSAGSLNVLAGNARKFAAAGDMVGNVVPLDGEKLKAAPRRPTNVGRDADTTLLAYEPFDYDSERVPSREPGIHGTGWREAWSMPAKGVTADFRTSPGFKRGSDPSGMQGGSLTSTRRAAIVRPFDEPLRTDRDGAFYFSFLARCTERKGPDGRPCDVQLSLLRTAANDPQQNLAVGLSWSTGTISVCWQGGGANLSLPLEMQKTYLLTGKVVTSALQPDQVFLRLFGQKQPLPVDEPARWTLVSRPISTDAGFDSVQLQTVTGTPLSLDELRFGSTWSAVAAPYFTTMIPDSASVRND